MACVRFRRLSLLCGILAFVTVASSGTVNTLGKQTDVFSGRDFALALADPEVAVIVLPSSIVLDDKDWIDFPELPLVLRRNVTITSPEQRLASGDLPALDGAFVKDKLRLAPGVVLNITGVVLTRYREDMPSTSPGMDLVGISDPLTDPSAAMPLLLWNKVALNNRLCFPADWSRKSVLATPRPAIWPGVQNATSDLSQDGCVNDTSAPWLSRCWAVRRRYNDIGTPGAVFLPTNIRVPTNYLVHALDTELICSAVMPLDCVERLTPLGCYRWLLPKGPLDTTEAADAGAGASPSAPTPAGAIIGGVVGGVVGAVLLAALGTLAACVVRRRRQRQLDGPAASPSDAAASKTADLQQQRDTWAGWPAGAAAGGGDAGKEERDAGGGNTCSGECSELTGGPTGGSITLPAKLGEEPDRTLDLAQGYLTRISADPTMPVTFATPPRADMAMLSSPFGGVGGSDNGCEVKLMESAVRGAGSFGRVMEGMYQGQRVAVKVMAEVHQWGGPTESLLRSFAQEVEVMARCQHPNVVRLLAACLTPPRLCLVMELMEASLADRLYRRPGELMPLKTVLRIGVEIAKGLEYLHPTIVHRDLKPANVLLNDPWSDRPVVKITDFGLSRLRSTDVPTRTPSAGTPAYLAPEGFVSTNAVITHKADIYSFAMLMWEMVTGITPWRDLNLMQLAVWVGANGYRPAVSHLPPARCPPKLRALLRECWDADPQRRPAAAELVKGLTLILQEVTLAGDLPAGASAAGPSCGPLPAPPPLLLLQALKEAAAAAAAAGGGGVAPGPGGGGCCQGSERPRVLAVAKVPDAASPAAAAAAMSGGGAGWGSLGAEGLSLPDHAVEVFTDCEAGSIPAGSGPSLFAPLPVVSPQRQPYPQPPPPPHCGGLPSNERPSPPRCPPGR